jgi:hypothetical protein
MPNLKTVDKIRVKTVRDVYTYVEMWLTADYFLQIGLEKSKGSFYQYMASLIFRAFSLEAYLNHIGNKLFSCWRDVEHLSPIAKLNLIAEHLKIKVHYGKRPWQIMKKLFKFRNYIAHGKTDIIRETRTWQRKKYKGSERKLIKTEWEKDCTEKNAKKAQEDVKNIIEVLHAAAMFEDIPFVTGIQTRHESLSD